MSDVRREVNEYNQAVLNNTFACDREACSFCHFPRPSPSTTAPGGSSASASTTPRWTRWWWRSSSPGGCVSAVGIA